MKKITISEVAFTDDEIEAAVRILRSGALRQGKECEAFENEFAQKTGAKFAITCSSGTAALHLAYLSFLKPGDEVLVPSFTFIATGSMVAFSGGRPIFCDVDPDTFLIDLQNAEKHVTKKTKAIAPVHLFGNPCDVPAIQDFAQRHGLIIVWDAAQAHGARYNNCDVGSFSDFVCYSFYPSKNMFVGEGGMICVQDQKFERIMRFTRSHGQTGKYLHTMLGLNYRMTDVEGAIGRRQLTRLDQMLSIRTRNAQVLTQGLSNIPGITPQKLTQGASHAWHQYCVLIDPNNFGMDRDALATALKEKGIATGIHYPRGLHQQPVFEAMFGKQSLPNTEFLAQNILALPVHHGLNEEDITQILEAIYSCSRS